MSDAAPLLGLDPFRAQPMEPAPFFERRTKPDHVQKRLLPPHPANRRAVVGVEVAVHGDAACLRKRDGLLDRATLKVLFAHRCRWDGTRTAGMVGWRVPGRAENRPP